MHRLFSQLFGTRRKSRPARHTKRKAPFRPVFDSLEDRSCPAVMVSFSNHALKILGDNLANQVTITQDDAHNLIRVEHDARTDVFASSQVNAISVDLKGGDDRLFYALDSDYTQAKSLAVNLGAGNDEAALDFGLHKSHTLKANLSIGISAGSGDDKVRADFGDLEGPTLSFSARMEDGKDQAEVYRWGVQRNTKVSFTLDGGNQDDTLYFYTDNGAWGSATESATLLGGEGNDSLKLFFDDAVLVRHSYVLRGGAGNDTLDAQMHVRAGSATGLLSAQLLGDDGNDTITVRMDEVHASASVAVWAGAGNDTVQADFGLPFGAGNVESAKLSFFADLGDGNDAALVNLWGVLRGNSVATFQVEGGKGDDSLRFTNDNGSHAAAKLSVTLNGGDGDDAISLFYDDIVNGAYAFRVDGGKGNDTIQAAIHERVGGVGSMYLNATGGDGSDSFTVQMDEVRVKTDIGFSGGAGNDTARADFGLPFGAGNIESAKLKFQANMDDGDDKAEAYLWGVLRGTSDATIQLLGGKGNDQLGFRNDNGSHAGASLFVDMDGGEGNDVVGLFFDDNMVGKYTFRLSGGAGNDAVGALIMARSGSTGSLDAYVSGGQGRDFLAMDFVDQSARRLRVIQAVVDGGFDIDPDVLVSRTPNVRVIRVP